MQALAQENNLAETAFLLKTADSDRFGLRWFSPAREIPLCGHATMAAGHVLMSELDGPPRITFETMSGPLTVSDAGGRYEMNFPADPPLAIATPDGLAEAIGAPVLECWAGAYLVAILDNEAVVRSVKPDFRRLAIIGGQARHGPGNVCVAAVADKGAPYQVISRFFAPGVGIPEDPATGSAHCILSPLFSHKLERDHLSFFQAFPGRGAELNAQIIGSRVILAGRAVTVIDSRLRV